MKIAFFGSSLLSAYWNGVATYYRGILKALSERGHRITFYEPDAFGRQHHRDMEPPDWAEVVVYANRAEAALCQVERARDADLLVKASGVGVFDVLLEEAVLAQKRAGCLVAFWDVEAPATLERVLANPHDPFGARIGRFDVIFTVGGGDPVMRDYTALGARVCAPIYSALDPRTHFPVPPEARFAADLSFLGNRLPDRETRVRHFFLDVAGRLPERHFLLGGNGWFDVRKPENVQLAGHVYTADHNALNGSALAVLHICRESMVRYGFSPAPRVFEAAGAGACLISDEWEGIEKFFEPSLELLVARDGQEVAELLHSLTPAKARQIGQRAHRRAIAEHTYERRAEEVERVLGARTRASLPKMSLPLSPVPGAPC